MERTSAAAIAKELKLAGEIHTVSQFGVAELIRHALHRWRLSPRRSIVRFVREQLRAAELAEHMDAVAVNNVIQHLDALGECTVLVLAGQEYIAPGRSRWIATGENTAAVLGVDPLPREVLQLPPLYDVDIVRRIAVRSQSEADALHAAGVERIDFDEWLVPLHYVEHASRRIGRPVSDDKISLEMFWEILTRCVVDEGRPISNDADYRVLGGEPGSFFGRHDSENPQGRWNDHGEDGIWCGFRRGYGESHWHPSIISIQGDVKRTIDLYDIDEWRWALIARGKALHSPESVVREANIIRFTYPLPFQISAAMDLLGPSVSPWSWELTDGAPLSWLDLL